MEQFDPALQVAKRFADTVLSKPLGELSGILPDTIGYWRLKNQVRLMLKAKERLEEKKIDTTKLLPDIFVPILEEGSKIKDEQSSNMFATLLASHLDGRTQDRVHPSFSKALTQLAPCDGGLCLGRERLPASLRDRWPSHHDDVLRNSSRRDNIGPCTSTIRVARPGISLPIERAPVWRAVLVCWNTFQDTDLTRDGPLALHPQRFL